jgi:hypothetical protein
VFNSIIKYAWFASASYADDCSQPPYNSVVIEYFNDNETDTQGTLFRDEMARAIILSFRGTSTPADFETDLAFDLVPLHTLGTQCQTCKVRPSRTLIRPYRKPKTDKTTGSPWLPRVIQRGGYRHCGCYQI